MRMRIQSCSSAASCIRQLAVCCVSPAVPLCQPACPPACLLACCGRCGWPSLQVGFGDVVAETGAEVAIVIFVEVLGVLFFALLISSISELLAQANRNARRLQVFRAKMQTVERWMLTQALPPRLQRRIKHFYADVRTLLCPCPVRQRLPHPASQHLLGRRGMHTKNRHDSSRHCSPSLCSQARYTFPPIHLTLLPPAYCRCGSGSTR